VGNDVRKGVQVSTGPNAERLRHLKRKRRRVRVGRGDKKRTYIGEGGQLNGGQSFETASSLFTGIPIFFIGGQRSFQTETLPEETGGSGFIGLVANKRLEWGVLIQEKWEKLSIAVGGGGTMKGGEDDFQRLEPPITYPANEGRRRLGGKAELERKEERKGLAWCVIRAGRG